MRYELKIWSRDISNLNTLISNCNKVILFLDTLEEIRPLYTIEFNFRKVLKEHLAKLLRSRNIYWRKRYTVNRVKFGDECTKFFHAMAIVSYRKNTIPQLMNDNGVMISDHEGKAARLWSAYKNRMGVSLNPEMRFDLDQLIQVNIDFSSLILPISKVDRIVKAIPSNKAPGPDGFNVFSLRNAGHL